MYLKVLKEDKMSKKNKNNRNVNNPNDLSQIANAFKLNLTKSKPNVGKKNDLTKKAAPVSNKSNKDNTKKGVGDAANHDNSHNTNVSNVSNNGNNKSNPGKKDNHKGRKDTVKGQSSNGVLPSESGSSASPSQKGGGTKGFVQSLRRAKLADLNKLVLDTNYFTPASSLSTITEPLLQISKNLVSRLKDMVVKVGDSKTITVADTISQLTATLDESIRLNNLEYIMYLLHQYERFAFNKPVPKYELGLNVAEQLDSFSYDSDTNSIYGKPYSRLDNRREPSSLRVLTFSDLIITQRAADYINSIFNATGDAAIKATTQLNVIDSITDTKINYVSTDITPMLSKYNDKA